MLWSGRGGPAGGGVWGPRLEFLENSHSSTGRSPASPQGRPGGVGGGWAGGPRGEEERVSPMCGGSPAPERRLALLLQAPGARVPGSPALPRVSARPPCSSHLGAGAAGRGASLTCVSVIALQWGGGLGGEAGPRARGGLPPSPHSSGGSHPRGAIGGSGWPPVTSPPSRTPTFSTASRVSSCQRRGSTLGVVLGGHFQ